MQYCKLSSNSNSRINGRKKILLNSGSSIGSTCSSGNDPISATKVGGKTTSLWCGSMIVIPKKYRNHLFLYSTVAFASCSMLSKETGFSEYIDTQCSILVSLLSPFLFSSILLVVIFVFYLI